LSLDSAELAEEEEAGARSPRPAGAEIFDPPPSSIARFRVVHTLGRGGQGLVLRVLDPNDVQRPLALKILLSLSRGGLLRFRREFQAVHQLTHPHVVRVYELGFYEGFPYFTMEYIEGTNLRSLVWRQWGGPGSATLARNLGSLLELIRQVVEALGYVHARRLVHRDLKPDNIMVTDQREAKLMDFGLAKDLNDQGPGTQVGTVLGTAAYMAPEQILGRQELDGRTDYYALGVTLYELVTGSWPFMGDTDWVILQRHLNEAPRPPREIAPWLDPEVERLILGLMAREPRDRPSSAQEILARLDPLLARGRYEPAPASAVAPAELLVPALVGHEDLGCWLEVLLQNLSEITHGPQVALISGKIGLGKSRLLRSVEEWARRKLLPVHRTSCRPEKRAPFSAFAPLIEALAPFWIWLSAEKRSQLEAVAALVPALRPESESAVQVDARHAFQATLHLLELALDGRPMVFLIDDVHWADELSLEFLQTLARLPTTLPLILVATYRPEQSGGPLNLVLDSDPSSELYLRKQIEPLTPSELAELVGSALGVRPEAVSAELLKVLAQAAQGSPLVALQTLELLAAERWLRRVGEQVVLAAGSDLDVLSGTVLLPRGLVPVASMEDLEARILDLCAAYGTGLPMELLTLMLDEDEAKLLDALNRLIHRAVLRAIRNDEAFEFAQHAVRDAVYERLPEERRRELHGLVARVLETRHGEAEAWAEVLAYHFRRAGQGSAALRHLERSIRKSLRLHAYRDALRGTGEALELMEDLDLDEARWAQKNKLLTDRSQAWYRLGHLDEALAASEAALEAARRAGSVRMQVGAENNLGLISTARRQFDRARSHYETALALAREERLQDLEPLILNNLGNLQVRRGQGEEALEQVQRALERASRLGDESVRVNALLNLTELELNAGQLSQARERLAQLQTALTRPEHAAEAVLARVLQGIGWRRVGQWHRAEQLWREAVASSKRLSRTLLVQRTLLELAELELERGRLGAAESWLAGVLEEASDSTARPHGGAAPKPSRLESAEAVLQQPNFRLRFRRLRADIETQRCAWGPALQSFESLQLNARLEDPVEGLAVALSHGRALTELGQFHEAAAILERLEKECTALGVESLRMEVRFARLRLLLETNRVTQEVFGQMAALEAEAEERGARLWVRRIQLWELASLGDPDSPRWQEAFDAFAREEAMSDLARAVLQRAETMLLAGRKSLALSLIEEREPQVLGPGLPWLELAFHSLRAATDPTAAGADAARLTLERLRQMTSRLREQDRSAFLMRPSVQVIRRRLAGAA
jgi:tetratricopeptide (TPR) repeat protein